MPDPREVQPLGRREHNKREKLERIKHAAREIFRDKGYEAATTREIAARAEVAYATLFAYVPDKREIFLMVVNEDLDRVTDAAFERALRKGPLVEQVLEFFRPRFDYWRKEREFSRYAVQQSFEAVTQQRDELRKAGLFRERRPLVITRLAALVRAKQEAGEIVSEDPEIIARLFMAIYQSEAKNWLEQHKPDTPTVLKRMRRMLELTLRGLSADRKAV